MQAINNDKITEGSCIQDRQRSYQWQSETWRAVESFGHAVVWTAL